ncbi:hypothetical protein [Sulfobacillus thermosulfidooxidans]|uniref:hypothetical protein n=1 Tax=Sulfobacillus thermosulfidooxidans TaxID=28034 RepID=UPI00031476DE|nr:hypothetical protein [Sulfobacillus thermosulfidooxidans]
MSLPEQLNNARLVRYDDKTKITMAWFGGRGIHVYTADGREVEVYNMELFDAAGNPVLVVDTLSEIIHAMQDIIARYRGEMLGEW